MSRAQPLVTPEELQSLLGTPPARSWAEGLQRRLRLPRQLQLFHFGALLWLVKGVFLYWALMNLSELHIEGTSRYVWMRTSLEGVGLLVFALASWHPRGARVARGALLVGCTTLVMDLLSLMYLP